MSIIYSSSNERQQRIRWYQWEFLRRNPNYRHDISKYDKTFGAWFEKRGHWFDRNTVYCGEDQKFFLTKIVPACKELSRKWSITHPVPPDWDFDRCYCLHEYRVNEFVDIPTGGSETESVSRWIIPIGMSFDNFIDRLRSGSRPRPARIDSHFLQVELNFERPIKDLLDTVHQLILFAKSNREPPEDRSFQSKRSRLEDYDEHLKTYDHFQDGKTTKEIAQILYPDEYEHKRTRESTLERLRGHHKAARKLIIDKGYQDLR